jgi:acetyl-CoA carboxylase beta subunit
MHNIITTRCQNAKKIHFFTNKCSTCQKYHYRKELGELDELPPKYRANRVQHLRNRVVVGADLHAIFS